MGFRFTPRINKVIKLLERNGFYVDRMRGDHIMINRHPPLSRPIVLVNVKKPSNAVRLNLLKECHEAGVDREIIEELNRILY